MIGLFLWTTRDLMREIRLVTGKADMTEAECRTWARLFVRRHVPWWAPGRSLPWSDAMEVGAAFAAELAAARRTA